MFRYCHGIYRLSPYFGTVQKKGASLVLYDALRKQMFDSHGKLDVQFNDFELISTRASLELSEEDVIFDGVYRATCMGITQFLNDHQGFRGIIKQQPEDFIVNEILLNREVVHLTNLGEHRHHGKVKSESANEKVTAILNDYLTMDVIEKILEIHSGKKTDSISVKISHLSKGSRSRLRTCFQKHLPNVKVKTAVKSKDKFLIIQSSSQSQVTIPTEVKPSYFHFVLLKVDTPSFDACYTICNILNIPIRKLCVAGLKDKRGVTCQMVSIDCKDLSFEKLAKVNKCHKLKIGNFHLNSQPVSLGNIYGNHFEIVLRDISAPRHLVETALQNVQRSGFINYFGLQRFGWGKASYQIIGKKLLQKNWLEAVELILQPREYPENEKITQCRRVWWETRNPREALKCLDSRFRFSREALLLKGLANSGKNEYKAALKFIPKTLFKFYFNSYDSYLWNAAVSKRFERHGRSVIEGDVFVDTKTGKHVVIDSIQNCNVNIANVMLPIFGTRVPLPNNEMGDIFRELLTSDGLNEDMVNANELNSKYGLYRQLIAFPEKMKWTFISYDDVNEHLSLTDYDKIQGLKEVAHSTTGKRTALRLEFDLSACFYATMTLREIMKT